MEELLSEQNTSFVGTSGKNVEMDQRKKNKLGIAAE